MAKHAKERAFFDMSGADNIYKYITTEGKIFGEQAKKFTMLEYLQKSTGVFNQNGNRHYRGQNKMPSAEQVGGFLRVHKILKGGKHGTT